jgi:cyclin B
MNDNFNQLDNKTLRRMNKLETISKRSSRVSKEMERNPLFDMSDSSIIKCDSKKDCLTESSQLTTNTSITNYNYYSNPNNNLEVIIEQETQRTLSIHETAQKSLIENKNFNIYNDIESANNKFNFDNIPTNPQFSNDYIIDIYNNYLEEERNMKIIYGYMIKQNEVNELMRAILIDWIIDIHLKFKLATETLFLTVYLIDKYLSEIVIERDNLQLLGVVALLIACKYEEILSPELRDFQLITDNTYTAQQINEFEINMLMLLEFNVTVPSSFRFYEIISKNINLSLEEFYFGRYLLELFLIDYRYTKYFPSQIALSVCFLVINLYSEGKNSLKCKYLREFLESELNYDNTFNNYENIIKECCKDICFIMDNIDKSQLFTVKKKYLTDEHFRVSKFERKYL